MSKPLGKCGVLLVTLPEGVAMHRPWDLPDRIAAGELYVRNVGLCSALGFALCFNKRQLSLGLPDAQWAIVIRRGHMVYRPDEEADAAADGDWEQLDPEEAAAESRRLVGKMYSPRGRSPAAADNNSPMPRHGQQSPLPWPQLRDTFPLPPGDPISQEMPRAAIAAAVGNANSEAHQ